MNGNAGTIFALIGGGLLIYFLAQSLKSSAGVVQGVVNTGVGQ
jgi:hypothetical protein